MNTLPSESGKRSIAGLAILTANLEEGRDYIDLFVPMVSECIRVRRPKIVSVADLQSQMKDMFGMQIPQNAMKLVLHRAAKKGYVELRDKTYVPNFGLLDTMNFGARYQDIIRQQYATIGRLVKYSSDRFSITITETEAENALLAYLEKHDIEILDCFLHVESPMSFKPESNKKLDYIVSAFVAECYKGEPEGFKYLDTIVKGHFLSHTLFFPDLSQIKKRFSRTDIYLDTALLLRILGYEGEARQEPCKELANLLYQEGATLKCFCSTRDEVKNILYACMVDMEKGDLQYAGPAYNYLRRARYGASDIQLELAILDSNIENAGIRIVDLPAYSAQFQIDEVKLNKALGEKLNYRPQREKQRKHDVDCLSAIYRLRKGHESIYIEDSVATFVTANPALCNVAAHFFVDEANTDKNCVPTAITDYSLTALLWLKRPMAVPGLPVKRLIAECYAAVEPNERMWGKYVETVSRLKDNHKISENDYNLLRYSQVAHKQLMELTLGDENVITEGTIDELLETAKGEIRREGLAALEQERAAHEETKKEDVTKLEEERRQREESERKLEFERTANKRRWERVSQNIEHKSRRIAKWASICVFGALMVIVAAGALFGLIQGWGHAWNYVLLFCYLVFVGLSIYNLVKGVTIKKLMSRFEVTLARRIQSVLNRWFLRQESSSSP